MKKNSKASKSSLKTSTDNLCGPSREGNKEWRTQKKTESYLRKNNWSQMKKNSKASKSSLKTSTDNLCGPSREGNKEWRTQKKTESYLRKNNWSQIKKNSKASKSSLKTSTDNLCGPSREGNKEWRTQKKTESYLRKNNWSQIKIFEYRRVWSWLRLNAGGRPNTCKSNGNMMKACFRWWRVADGWVKSGKLPDRGGQQLETVANTAYTLRGKVERRCQMCPDGIS